MADESKKLLLVDGDQVLLEKLGKRLAKAQFSVRTAADGAAALEAALLEKPDLVITNYHLPLFDGERLKAFLRNNPTTSHIPFIFIIDAESRKDEILSAIGPEISLTKPFRWQEINSKIHEAFKPKDESDPGIQSVGAGVEGSLREVSLVDLLQIFGLNRRTGILVLLSDGHRGNIYLRDGVVQNADVDEITGEKALFRILRWREGTFRYKPQEVDVPRSITRTMDGLLMEGMRQLDEWDTLRDKLPSPDAILKVDRVARELPSDLRPVTQEILLLLEFYDRTEDILDKATHTDYDVCKSLLGLLQKGIVSVVKEGTPVERREEPLITGEQAIEILKLLEVGEGDSVGKFWGKILLVTLEGGLIKPFLADATSVEGFGLSRDNFSNQEIINSKFGNLGTLDITDKSRLHLFVLPAQDDSMPLWRSFSRGAIGAIVLRGEEEPDTGRLERVTDFMDNVLQRPYVLTTVHTDGEDAVGSATISFTTLFEMALSANRRKGKEAAS